MPVSSWFNAPAWLPLVHALLHTLWQGALLAGGLFLALRLVPARRANLRYGLSAAVLTLVLLSGLGSWALLDSAARPRPALDAGSAGNSPSAALARVPGNSPAWRSAAGSTPNEGHATPRAAGAGTTEHGADASGSAKPWVRQAAVFWLLGVCVSLLRAARGAFGVGRLRRRCRDLADPRILALAAELRGRLRLSGRVRYLVSEEIGVPAVMGVLWPAVLVPASLLTGVPMDQLRAILAHELAHIRRGDYLVNLAQMFVEALLFFNPFVWWISRQMRLEREACCDQLAAGECQSPAHYVEALVAVMERSRSVAAPPTPVLAASGPRAQGGDALDRARRLLVPGYQPTLRLGWLSLVAVMALSGLALSGLWLGTRAVAQTIKTTEQPVKSTAAPKAEPAAPPVGSLAAEAQSVPGQILAAARAGEAGKISGLLTASYSPPGPSKFSQEDAAKLLDGLVDRRELKAFTTLYDELVKTNFGREWKPGDTLLAGLAKDGRTDFLDVLFARRLDPDRLRAAAKSADGPTAGWIERRAAEVARQRADVEALEKAAGDGDLAALQRLLDGGADVNGVGKDDNTPLIRAVFKNRLEAAQFLLDHGAQVDKPRLPGWNFTPLCLVNSVPMAELLKKNGANVHAKLFERDVSILTYVADWAKADVVAWFLQQGLDPKMIGDNGENLLFGLKDGATAEVLLEAGADPNQTDEFGYTPLTAAQSAEVARALIRHGANLKPKLKDGETLLECAVVNTRRTDDTPQEQAGYIEELIKQGAEFDPKGNGAKAMIRAAFSDRVGEVQAFLDHGVSPNAQDDRGPYEHTSALGSAAWQAPKSLKLLLDRGADPNAPLPADERNPVNTALAAGAYGNVELLRQAGARGLSDLAFYSAKGDAAKVSELLGQKADSNEPDPSGATPLYYAVQHAQVEVAKRLLEHGASVDQFDAWGISPYLHFALYQTMIEWDPGQARLQWHLSPPEAKARLAGFQQLFAQYPPDPAYRDAAGRTALHQAAWAGNSAILGVMLDGKHSRFDPNLPDKEGKTPLLLAALSPVAKETQQIITSDINTPQQKTWNQQAHLADELIKSGARLDLVLPGGKTVGELALEAARDANNTQLVSVLAEAGAARADTGGTKPGEPSAAPTAVPERGDEKPAPASPPSSLAALALPYKLAVTPETKKPFQDGDGIEIRQIIGSAASFQTGGTYRITGVCRQRTLKNATLYIGNTAEAGSDAIAPVNGSSLYTALPSGSTEFDCTFKLFRPGTLHLTIYDLDNHDRHDNAYAGIYLGKVAFEEEEFSPITLENTAGPLPESTPPPKSAWPPRPADWPARPFEICRVHTDPQPGTQPEVRQNGREGEKTTYYVEKKAILDEGAVQSVSVRNDGGRRSIVILLTPGASQQFAEFTRQNIGQKIEIFCDGWSLLSTAITKPFSSSELVFSDNFVPWLENMIVSANTKTAANP